MHYLMCAKKKLQAMSAADVVFRLGYMMVLSAKLFHWDRMIFPVR